MPVFLRQSMVPSLFLLCLLLSACGSKPVRTDLPGTPVASAGSDRDAHSAGVTMRALGLVGTPYRYGGNTPASGFDCSGLVTYVFADMLDIRLPRTSRELSRLQGPRIAPGQLRTGDLVFFGKGQEVWHVGIYVGEGRFVHAPSTGGTVRLDALENPYWTKHYSGAKRVL